MRCEPSFATANEGEHRIREDFASRQLVRPAYEKAAAKLRADMLSYPSRFGAIRESMSESP